MNALPKSQFSNRRIRFHSIIMFFYKMCFFMKTDTLHCSFKYNVTINLLLHSEMVHRKITQSKKFGNSIRLGRLVIKIFFIRYSYHCLIIHWVALFLKDCTSLCGNMPSHSLNLLWIRPDKHPNEITPT